MIATRRLLCLAALACSSLLAETLSYTGSEQTYTVSTGGVYLITLAGAQGGSSSNASGGDGAVIGGDYSLTMGTTLDIFAGGQGGSGVSGGGGGGTFIVFPNSTLLAAAGGGGGAGSAASDSTGQAGQTTTAGGNGGASGLPGGAGGQNGSDGSAAAGGGGAGFLGNYANGFAGGMAPGPGFPGGGYGGGGAANVFGGGGGGGYSGGGGGNVGVGGGGGGSYLDPLFSSISLTSGANQGDGYVTITLATPEPASLGLLALALCGLSLAEPLLRRYRGFTSPSARRVERRTGLRG